ncbi:hypothetical protein EYF80_030190 [Liparis tanakae]|uniref:Uncharacterized protein n=1 Tax=Liparis tanakae TaxID=230148 RepID=A0A4Z2H189_9TELE|nr:hypothetical protein EYF80_030190 [Liparis tanakae]
MGVDRSVVNQLPVVQLTQSGAWRSIGDGSFLFPCEELVTVLEEPPGLSAAPGRPPDTKACDRVFTRD